MAGTRLSEEEEARRLELYYEGNTDEEMARVLKRKPATITTWREHRGLPPHPQEQKDEREQLGQHVMTLCGIPVKRKEE